MVLPGPPGGRVQRRRPNLKTHARFDSIEAGVGLFASPGFYGTSHAETLRTQREARGAPSAPPRLCGRRSVRAIAMDDYGASDAGAAYSPHERTRVSAVCPI